LGNQTQLLTPVLAGAETWGSFAYVYAQGGSKFQLRASLGAKVEIGRPVTQFELVELTSVELVLSKIPISQLRSFHIAILIPN
jgi:hypothetical protein